MSLEFLARKLHALAKEHPGLAAIFQPGTDSAPASIGYLGGDRNAVRSLEGLCLDAEQELRAAGAMIDEKGVSADGRLLAWAISNRPTRFHSFAEGGDYHDRPEHPAELLAGAIERFLEDRGPTKGDRKSEGPTGGDGFLGGQALANALGIDPARRGAFLRQVDRKRNSLPDEDWLEVGNPHPNAPRFLYRVASLVGLAKYYR